MNSLRYVGLDVHRKTVQACIRAKDDTIILEKNFECTREGLRAFAREHLNPGDHVALEATFHSWSIVDEISPFVGKVIVSNPMATKAIAQSKVKTDRVDARVLSELLRIGYLPEVWTPEPETRQLRNLCARRASLVPDRVRLKNRIHGVLAKCLIPRPAEIFDEKGRRWLASLELPEWASAKSSVVAAARPGARRASKSIRRMTPSYPHAIFFAGLWSQTASLLQQLFLINVQDDINRLRTTHDEPDAVDAVVLVQYRELRPAASHRSEDRL